MNLIEVMTRRGIDRITMETPTRLMRAYFGEHWVPLEQMSEEMLLEAAVYLERLALEFRPRDSIDALIRRAGALLVFILGLAFIDATLWQASAKRLKAKASAPAGHALQVR